MHAMEKVTASKITPVNVSKNKTYHSSKINHSFKTHKSFKSHNNSETQQSFDEWCLKRLSNISYSVHKNMKVEIISSPESPNNLQVEKSCENPNSHMIKNTYLDSNSMQNKQFC